MKKEIFADFMIDKIRNILLLSVLLFNTANVSYADGHQKDIQAVFLYNLVNYIFWPNDKNNNVHNICLVNDPSMENYLLQIQKRAKERGSIINVYNVNGVPDEYLKNKICHILFFSENAAKTSLSRLAGLHAKNVLTVSAAKNFSRNGSVEFAFLDGRLKLILNTKKLKESGLSASSKLLRLAKVVSN